MAGCGTAAGGMSPAALRSLPGPARGRQQVRGAPRERGAYYRLCTATLSPTSCHRAELGPKGSTPSPFGLHIHTHIDTVCVWSLTCFSFAHVRGYFPGNHHHQPHLGHGLTPPPAAALGGRRSCRHPSSAPLRSAPRSAGAPEARSSPRPFPICSEAVAKV